MRSIPTAEVFGSASGSGMSQAFRRAHRVVRQALIELELEAGELTEEEASDAKLQGKIYDIEFLAELSDLRSIWR